MDGLTDWAYLPAGIAMSALLLASGFFSCSEAALFYLSRQDRRAFKTGNQAQRIAAGMLATPDRLLTAVLFWNLVVNVLYFAIASVVSLRLEHAGHSGQAGVFALISLLVIIFLSEMLPKSLAVVQTQWLATAVAIPVAAAVRLLDPIMPSLQMANLLSRRVLWPRFEPEPYLDVSDLERAVRQSGADEALVEQEQIVLENILSLSNIKAEELMRPRIRFLVFRPPVSLADLEGRLPPSGYTLVSEPDGDEVAGAVPIAAMPDVPRERLEHYAEDVIYVPWCTSVANILEKMRVRDRRVAAVVNEFGETIGILTWEDIFDTIFGQSPSRSARLLKRKPIREVRDGVWHVTGMTRLWRLCRYFEIEGPRAKSHTVAGMVQEALGRLPERGDRGRWGDFDFEVVDVPDFGELVIELTRSVPVEEQE